MSDKIFLDTNVLIYCYTSTEPAKQLVAAGIAENPDVWISTQVLQEFANTLRKKFAKTWSEIGLTLEEINQNFQVFANDFDTIRTATGLADRYGYSFYDSMILASSLNIGCAVVFSEDMQHGQVIEGKLEIKNPFLT